MVKVSPNFLLTLLPVSPAKVMPWLILLISVASMVTLLNLLMVFLASSLSLTVYSSPPVLLLVVLLLTVI